MELVGTVLGVDPTDHYERFGGMERRKRPEEQGLDEAEGGGGTTDPERQRRYGDGCGHPALAEQAKGKTEILNEIRHWG